MAHVGSLRRTSLVHSRCVQLDVDDVCKEAISIFSTKDKRGEIPLVLIPSRRWTCSFMMQVPSGVWCLLQKYGRNCGTAKPGLNWYPGWSWRIAYVVSQQSNTYDAPVIACPTSDNVRVEIDVVLVFKIVDPEKFVYNLGAANFDDFLNGTVDEAVRKLVRQQDIYNVYDLRGGEKTDSMMQGLNEKFDFCGVRFTDVKITAVWLPEVLAKCLEETTKIAKSQKKLIAKHNFEILGINQDCDMELAKIERATDQALVAEKGRMKQAEIEYEQRKVKAEQEGDVQRIQAEQEVEVAIMEKQQELQRKEKSLETYRIMEIAKAETECATKKAQGDISAEAKLIEGSWQEEEMMCDAQATKHEAVAEAEASRCLIEKRKHEADLREKSILQKLAASGNFNLIGVNADKLIQAMLTGSFEQTNK